MKYETEGGGKKKGKLRYNWADGSRMPTKGTAQEMLSSSRK